MTIRRKHWPKRPIKDWSLEPKKYAVAPPAPIEAVLKARAAMNGPDPLAVINGGLREGDHLFIQWLAPEKPGSEGPSGFIRGCQIMAYRDRDYLKWAPAGPLRDLGGNWLYAPYLTSVRDVNAFADTISVVSGFALDVTENTPTSFLARLRWDDERSSRRVIVGDKLFCDLRTKSLSIERELGTIDMNLYTPPDKSNLIYGVRVQYLSMAHHSVVMVRIVAEVNGLMASCVGGNKYVCVRK